MLELPQVFTDAQLQMEAANEAAISEREKEINQIAKSILGLTELIEGVAEIFKDLNVMVIDQGSILDRIDYNIEQTNVSLEKGHEELQKVLPLNGSKWRPTRCREVWQQRYV